MDSSESPVHGDQEGAVWNGHFQSKCLHPLVLSALRCERGPAPPPRSRLYPGQPPACARWRRRTASTPAR
jgi:hypothetical protein